MRAILSILFLIFSLYAEAQALKALDFAQLPDVRQLQLSPDGEHLAYLARLDGDKISGIAVTVSNIESGKQSIVTYGENEKFVITRISWANNDTLFIHATFPETRWGVPTKESRLLLANIHTKKIQGAISKSKFRRFAHFPQFQDRIIDPMPNDPQYYLLQIDNHTPNQPSVYKMSMNGKSMKLVQKRKEDVYKWKTDRQHRVRLGITMEGNHFTIIHRAPEQKKWLTLWEFDLFSGDEVWPLGFSEDPNELYIEANHEGKTAIFLVNLNDLELKKQLVYSDDSYDVDGQLFYSEKARKVVGFSSNGEYTFWDTSYKGLHGGINKALPETDNYFVSFSQNERRYILFTTNDSAPGTYYYGDRDKKSLVPVALQYEQLRPELLSKKQHISYKARDGLTIEGYLSLPKNHKEGMKHPTIIFPHGGPISHDGKGFDYWTQFFTASGYAVLQMNFRGSSGYGHDFMAAGLKNWGLSMQNDVEDGTHWMIEQGHSDADKICIVGASYGGYAALMGVVKTPDLYKCAISFAGVTDLSNLVKHSRKYTNYKIVKEMVGDNHKSLKQRSPSRKAEHINVPVLLIHGTKDRRVRIKHSKKMAKALAKHKKQVEYIELEGGDHFLSNQDHRIEAFTAIEKFLKKHLN